jgi:putative transcriptional regulator
MHDPMDWAVADALTDDAISAAALADPDAQPLSKEALARAHQGPPPRVVRHKLKLSREEFCVRYQIPLDTLVQWETRETQPDTVALAYMKVIIADPEGVAKALSRSVAVAHPRAAE